jgi:acid phosphatase type 7
LAEVYRPSLLPDRIILTWSDNPATTQAVTWRTSPEAGGPVAEITEARPGPDLEKNAQRVAGNSQPLTTDLGTAHYHSVQFDGLTPNTKYAYRVGDGTNWSEWFQFRTASEEPEPFSFIYFGDAQNDIRSMWSRVIREAFTDAPKARFLLHAGDLINRAEADAEWGEWFAAGHWLNAMIPSIAAPGNHEYTRDSDRRPRVSHHWRPQFAFPDHGPEGLEETCYTLVYQGVRIIVLDSNQKLDQQAEWLEEILESNTCRWVICSFHHPVFSTGKDRDNPELRTAWKPIFDKHRVDLVLQGHDHTYGRTGLETPRAPAVATRNVATGVTASDMHSGTVYVVSVSGPKMYNLQPHPFMVRTAEQMQLYQIIHVHGDTLRYEARTADGKPYDGFTLQKRADQPNELIEQVPDTTQQSRSTEEEAATP